MPILGIIAEYNPFHNGHLYHIQSAISAVSPSATLVALSGPFTQRGDLSLLSPFRRAECALKAGADAVFSLPVLWTVRDAEHYALGAVSLLSSLGVTHLAFGAETADPDLLQQTADLLEESPNPFQSILRGALADGKGYPAALAEAAGACLPESRLLLNKPNNILAVCYLRAIRRLNLTVRPVIIPREGSYHSDRILHNSPSASALRDSLRRGSWLAVLDSVPEYSSSAILESFLNQEIPDSRLLDVLLLEKLRSMSPEESKHLPDCPEGLDSALLKAAVRGVSREEMISQLTTRRYPAARISRLCTSVLLNITRERLEDLALPEVALILAMKKNPSVAGSWKNSPVKILNASKWQECADPEDLKAWRLWSLACSLPSSFLFTRKLPFSE